MFTENKSHVERGLFEDILLSLPENKRKKALASVEYGFYEEVFREIDEKAFGVLFDEKTGRPNAPVNCLVGAMVLRQLRGWTYEELFDNIDFNVLTRLALGMTDMAETPFCAATLFNFQNRVVEYEREEKKNLLETVFERLTSKQLKRLGLKTGVQRSDSFRALSNVVRYGRLKLLIETLRRFVRILEEEDKQEFAELLDPYGSETSEGYVYRVHDSDLPAELKAVAKVYAGLHRAVGDRYAQRAEYVNFDRLFKEQIEITKKGPKLRRPKKLKSSGLQSPDDPEATYSKKNGEHNIGYKVNVTETADPENDVNLITDAAVDANNVGDGPMLAARMDVLKERTPELDEMHTDGAYGGEALDPKMKEHDVFHVETGSNAGKAKVPMKYERVDEGGYKVSCPGGQTAVAERTRTRFKAEFDKTICADCPFLENCQTEARKACRTLYFQESWAEGSIRSRNVELIPERRRTVRANVEATVMEFTGMFNHKGKMPLRGKSKIRIAVLSRAIAINFGRVRRYIEKTAAAAQIELKKSLSSVILAPIGPKRRLWHDHRKIHLQSVLTSLNPEQLKTSPF